ncbi:MAG: hypothetical protein KDD27_22145 [Saprospiraceae bacterium]|nr:hypothetical protein [Saprospiraceae bacterium]
MRILTFRFLFVLGVLSFAVGCKLSDEDKETIINVSPEFSLDLFESLGDTRQFQVLIKTVEPQACKNDVIDYSSNKTGNRLLLSLHEIIPTPDCNTGESLVNAEASFGFLENQTYDVEITLKDVLQNLGKLTVSESAYKLELETMDGIELVHHELKRVPANHIWGYVAYENKESSEALALGFINALKGKSSNSYFQVGYYGYFSINDNGQLLMAAAPEFPFSSTFHFKYDGSLADLEQLLASYRDNQNEQAFKIAIYTSDGKEL